MLGLPREVDGAVSCLCVSPLWGRLMVRRSTGFADERASRAFGIWENPKETARPLCKTRRQGSSETAFASVGAHLAARVGGPQRTTTRRLCSARAFGRLRSR